jgi:hypothetical protein
VLEEGFTAAAANYGGRVGVAFEYDEALAHLIQAGSDALIVLPASNLAGSPNFPHSGMAVCTSSPGLEGWPIQ